MGTIRKVARSIRRFGLRAGLGDALARWASRRLGVGVDAVSEWGFVLGEERPAALPPPRGGKLRLGWLLPPIVPGSGGLTTVLRAAHFLEKWGHAQTLYEVGAEPGRGRMRAGAAAQLFPVSADLVPFSGAVADCDALIATHWTTAYTARGLANTAAKFYFVQDLEHEFYPRGSAFELARQTYRFGFHGIAMGDWLAQTVRREFGMSCVPVEFSFDREIYSAAGPREAPARPRVLFYLRQLGDRRGGELGLLALSLVAAARPDVEIVLFGCPAARVRPGFPASLPGILPPPALARLYRSAEMILALSLTNLSLVPLEAMACGCPVVVNRGPNVEWLLDERVAELAAPTPRALAEGMLRLLGDPPLRRRRAAAGLAFAESTSWPASARAFEAALYRGLGIAAPATELAEGATT